MKLTNHRKYHCVGCGDVEGVVDIEESPNVILSLRDVFCQPEDKRYENDKRGHVYVEPGYNLSLKRDNLISSYKELNLDEGGRLQLRFAYWTDGERYYVEILKVDLIKGGTPTPLLTKKQYAETGSLPHRAVRTICHKFMELSVPGEAPAEPDGHSIH